MFSDDQESSGLESHSSIVYGISRAWLDDSSSAEVAGGVGDLGAGSVMGASAAVWVCSPCGALLFSFAVSMTMAPGGGSDGRERHRK